MFKFLTVLILLSIVILAEKSFGQNHSYNEEADNSFVVKSDTIRFDGFKYVLDRIEDKQAYYSKWEFECVQRYQDSLYIAHYFGKEDEKQSICIYFFDKNKFSNIYIKALFGYADTIAFRNLPIADSLRIPVNNEPTGQFLQEYHNQYFSGYRASFMTEDKYFHIVISFYTKNDTLLFRNHKFFSRICLSLKMISDTNKFTRKEYDSILDQGKFQGLLIEAYRTDNVEALKYCLDTLSAVSHTMTQSLFELKPEIEREAYIIYEKFYNPLNPDHSGHVQSEIDSGKSLEGTMYGEYQNYSYYLIQESIGVTLVDSFKHENNGEIQTDEIFETTTPISDVVFDNFQPRLNFPNKKVIYLSNFIVKFVLDDFFSKEIKSYGTRVFRKPESPRDKNLLRYYFLHNALHIDPTHSNLNWKIETEPLFKVFLNKSLDEAVVYIEFGYQGGELILKKEKGIWKMVSGRFSLMY